MRRRIGRALLALLALGVLAVAAGLVYARPLLKTGTGYAAHNACAVQLLAGRDADQPAQDLPDNPLVPYLRTSVDAEAGTARTSILGVLYPQTAYYTMGHGCTLAKEPGSLAPVATPPDNDPWNVGTTAVRAADPKVAAAIDQAFGTGTGDAAALGTRAVVVIKDGKLIAEQYAQGFSPQTRQLGWSMAKSVTNLMTGMLEKQGRLNRNDAALRPEWTDARRDITITDLLQMTPGLQWDETYDLGTPITRMLYLEPDMGSYAASLPQEHPRGTYQEYSSGVTNILCQVLQQRASATSSEGMGNDLARSLVFDRLGMSSAVLEPDASAHPVCSSYLWATPRDWAVIGEFARLNGEWKGEQLLPADWMSFSTTAVAARTEEQGHAAHWWVNRQVDGTLRYPAMPADAYWASGHDGQRVVVVPSAKLVVVRMGFTPTETDIGFDRLVASLVAAS